MEDTLKKLSILNQNFGACVGGDRWCETSNEGVIDSINPSNSKKIASVFKCSESDYEKVITASSEAFKSWRKVPAPVRGQLIFEMGNKLRENKV